MIFFIALWFQNQSPGPARPRLPADSETVFKK